MLSKNTMSWFITVRSCATLKHASPSVPFFNQFITVRNYITLKLIYARLTPMLKFITIRNCITLKLWGTLNSF